MRPFVGSLVGALILACGSASLTTMPGATGGGDGSTADAGMTSAGGGLNGGGSAGGGGPAGGGEAAGGSSGGGDVGGQAGGEAGGSPGGGTPGGGMAGGGMAGGGSAGCSASTCATGCCLNGTCQPGTQPLACGTMGAPCEECPTGMTCQQQSCGLDPASRWRIQPTMARIAGRKANGDAWDTFGGDPDVFVRLFCPATASSGTSDTPTSPDTLTPSWASGSCVMTTGALQSTGFAFEVWDEDGFLNANDLVSPKTTVRLGPSDFASPVLTRGPVGQTTAISFALTRL